MQHITSGWYTVGLDGKRIKFYVGQSTGYNEDSSTTIYFTPDEWDELMERAEIIKAQIALATKLENELLKKKKAETDANWTGQQ